MSETRKHLTTKTNRCFSHRNTFLFEIFERLRDNHKTDQSSMQQTGPDKIFHVPNWVAQPRNVKRG